MIWLDLDGVIVNFNKAGCKALGIPYPEKTAFHRDWLSEQKPDLSLSELFDNLHQNPRFWADMEPTRLCSRMLSFLDEHAPDWGMLTSAWRHPYCYAGKFEWVERNLGWNALNRMVMVSGHKERLAQPSFFLTDDLRSSCDKWDAAGGKSFHWVDYSEDMTTALDTQFYVWKDRILQHQESHK